MSSVSQGRQTNPLDLHCVGFIPRTNDGLLLLLISSPDCGLSKVHSVRICLLSGKIYHAVCFFWSVWYEIPLKLSNCIKQFLCLRHMGSQCTRLKSNYSGERKSQIFNIPRMWPFVALQHHLTHLWILLSPELLTLKICALGLLGVGLMAHNEHYITAEVPRLYFLRREE